ncbi:MAG: heme-binding protein [Bryobacteraceae bacterium]|jgi:uncharacterized protein GlcG (DUF336 family)
MKLSILLLMLSAAYAPAQVRRGRYTTDPVSPIAARLSAPAACPMLSANPPSDPNQLTAAEVGNLVSSAVAAAANPAIAVAVVDRGGRRLAIFRGTQATDPIVETALSLARAGAFFSSTGTPLSSRTVGYISAPNFPPGIPNQPAGALYGIANTNRGCYLSASFLPGQEVPRPLNATCTDYSAGIGTMPGGIPIFRNGEEVIGGIGVAGFANNDVAEYAAMVATQQNNFFVQLPLPAPGGVYLNGFLLPFLAAQPPTGVPAGPSPGAFQLGPYSGMPEPDGWLVGPNAGSVLSASDVSNIVISAQSLAQQTRAQIRLPIQYARMVISVADLDGTILGLYRMPDSPIFSIDVAATKARNVVYFSGPNLVPSDLPGVPMGTAVTNRTVGFGSQPFFPSGIDNTPPGPFIDLYNFDSANPCTQGHQPANLNQSGVVFFPGSAPLYQNAVMVGGLGVSGDGVDQDDYVTSGGAQGFLAPAAIRADQIIVGGVRLPYWKFPRDPELP